MEIVFYGVRGTRTVTGAQFARYGGDTACVGVNVNGANVLFDAGTGIAAAGAELVGSDAPVTIFLSHLHHDHLAGLPFFAPLFEPGRRVQVFIPDGMREHLLAYFAPPYYPLTVEDLPAEVTVTELPPNATVVCSGAGRVFMIDPAHAEHGSDGEHGSWEDWPEPDGRAAVVAGSQRRSGKPDGSTQDQPEHRNPDAVVVHSLRLPADVHPRDGVTVYAVQAGDKRVVYASDVEWSRASADDQRRLLDFVRAANVLIVDAQYAEEEYEAFAGRGHNTVLTATEVARAAEVDHVVLFHHDPHRDDAAIDELKRIANDSEAARGLGRVDAAWAGLRLIV